MMLESKAFSRGIAAMEDKDLDISFAGLKNSSTSFLRFTQIKDGNTISGKALAFLRCTILLWPSLPRTFNMLSEIAGKSKSMEDKNAGDEAMRWAERHISNHSNCEASRSPKHSISQGHAPNNIEVLAVCRSRMSSPQFLFLLMSQRWLCQLQLSTTGVQNVHRELTRQFWSSTVKKKPHVRRTRILRTVLDVWLASTSRSMRQAVLTNHLPPQTTTCSTVTVSGDSNWRGFHVKELCQHSTGVLVASSQPNALVREGNL